jgi:Protein of unknown function (DUF3738)
MEKRVMWTLVIAALPVIALPDLTGTWQGMLVGPRGEFRTVIKISKGDEAALKVLLYSIDQSAAENPGSMTVQGSNVKISIPGLSGTFDGKLSPDGSSIAGTWMRGSAAMTLSIKRVNDDAVWAIPKLKFDVASIKPSVAGVKQVSELRPLPGGRISATKMPLKNLIQVAYRVKPFQISGGPSWIESDPYDIRSQAGRCRQGGCLANDAAGAAHRSIPTKVSSRDEGASRLRPSAGSQGRQAWSQSHAVERGKLRRSESPVSKPIEWAVLRWRGRAWQDFRTRDADRGSSRCALQDVGPHRDRQNAADRKIRFPGPIHTRRPPSIRLSEPFAFHRPSRTARAKARVAKRTG